MHRAAYLGEVAKEQVCLIWNVPIKVIIAIIDDAPAIASFAREGDTNDVCSVSGQVSHLLVTFIRDVAVIAETPIVGDAPAISQTWRKRNTCDLSAILGQLSHLIVALIWNFAVHIVAAIVDDAPTLTRRCECDPYNFSPILRELSHRKVAITRDVLVDIGPAFA